MIMSSVQLLYEFPSYANVCTPPRDIRSGGNRNVTLADTWCNRFMTRNRQCKSDDVFRSGSASVLRGCD